MSNESKISSYESLSKEALIPVLHSLQAAIAERDQEIDKLQRHISNANRKQFVKKSEKLSGMQEELFSFEAQAEEVTEEIEVAGHKRTVKRGRKPLPEDLPRRRVEYFPEEKTCESCGAELTVIGEEITEELERIPARIEVIEHVKIKCACSKCHGARVKTGCLPEGTLPLPGCRPGAGLLTHIILSKYMDHLPLYRQEHMLLREGIVVTRQRMSDWVGQVVETLLMRLYRALKEETLRLSYVHADETTIKVRDLEVLEDNGKLLTGYLWAVLGPPNLAFFEYHASRASEAAKEVLSGFEGTVQTDFYAGYNAVLLPDKVERLACMAHIRRKFLDSRDSAPRDCDPIIKQIAKLYRFESEWKHLSAAERMENRQKFSSPELEKLFASMQALSQRLLPKHPLQEALSYALKQRLEMSRYIESGDFSIDNNPVEREIRPVALGRKNYLFAGSHEGAKRAAVLYSLLACCKLNKVNPKDWLTDVLKRINAHPVSRIAELLPHRWVASIK